MKYMKTYWMLVVWYHAEIIRKLYIISALKLVYQLPFFVKRIAWFGQVSYWYCGLKIGVNTQCVRWDINTHYHDYQSSVLTSNANKCRPRQSIKSRILLSKIVTKISRKVLTRAAALISVVNINDAFENSLGIWKSFDNHGATKQRFWTCFGGWQKSNRCSQGRKMQVTKGRLQSEFSRNPLKLTSRSLAVP